jgi:hypothetical protein
MKIARLESLDSESEIILLEVTIWLLLGWTDSTSSHLTDMSVVVQNVLG